VAKHRRDRGQKPQVHVDEDNKVIRPAAFAVTRPVGPGERVPLDSSGSVPAGELIRAAPGLAKLVAASAWQFVSWSASASAATANYAAKRAANGEPAVSILQDAAADLRVVAWKALGVRNEDGTPVHPDREGIRVASPLDSNEDELRRRGELLLRRSNDVHLVEDTHPAFARILSEITPDEARILRLLAADGGQPTVDIRTNRPFGVGSLLVASGLSMVAELAGCRYIDRIDQYVDNLGRLGLVEHSHESVTDPTRYQVLEAQPKVSGALKLAGRWPKIVQRSLHLTSFGAEFCRICLPVTTGHSSSEDQAQ
jgi:hypothetical protein